MYIGQVSHSIGQSNSESAAQFAVIVGAAVVVVVDGASGNIINRV